MPAVAITDHGNMYGAVDFYQQAYKAGIKPIIGCELYVAPKSRFDKTSEGPGETARHLIVLAKNLQGYRNLIKLTSSGFLEGFYYRPRVDKELLAAHSEGLIATSACLHGEVADWILKGDLEKAKASARQYHEIFGEGNYYLEMMENGIPEQSLVNEKLMEISKELAIPLVATNDCHYLERTDSEAHEVLLCIQTGKTMDDTSHMRFTTDAFYLKSPDEMKRLFAYCPEAVENTVVIAEKCNLKLDFNQLFLPHFEIGQGRSLDEHLQEMAKAGLEKLMPKILQGKDPSLRQKYEKRLERELDIIKSMGFAGYFLIVSDFINYAKSRNIPVGPGRGSAAGSLVAYAIGITEIDPIRYGLFFERFLNPDRKSMPDIDIDFCMEGRDEVIRYVSEKYGTDRRGPDHHLREDAGESGHPRRRARLEHALRRGGPNRQAHPQRTEYHPGRRHQAGTPAPGGAEAKREGPQAPRSVTLPGGPQPPFLDPRSRGRHFRQASRRQSSPVQEPQ